MKPLNELTGKGIFKWEDCQQKVFDTLKSIMAADCLNTYPDYNKPLEIYTDTSGYQLGAAICLTTLTVWELHTRLHDRWRPQPVRLVSRVIGIPSLTIILAYQMTLV